MPNYKERAQKKALKDALKSAKQEEMRAQKETKEQRKAEKAHLASLHSAGVTKFTNSSGEVEVIPLNEARKRWGQAQGHHGQVGGIASGKKRRELKAAQSVEVVHKVGGVWNCDGCDTFDCIRDISIFAFGNVTNVDVLLWMHNHHVCGDVKCKKCDGVVEVTCSSGEFRKVCGECGSRGRGFYSGWFSRTKLVPVTAMGLLWSIVSGVPFKFAKFDAARGVSGACWSRWVRSVGEVIAGANERVRCEKPVSWATSQWDEVCFGSRKCQRGKRVRHSGPQWALTSVHVDGDAQWKCSDTWFLTGKRQPWHH